MDIQIQLFSQAGILLGQRKDKGRRNKEIHDKDRQIKCVAHVGRRKRPQFRRSLGALGSVGARLLA